MEGVENSGKSWFSLLILRGFRALMHDYSVGRRLIILIAQLSDGGLIALCLKGLSANHNSLFNHQIISVLYNWSDLFDSSLQRKLIRNCLDSWFFIQLDEQLFICEVLWLFLIHPGFSLTKYYMDKSNNLSPLTSAMCFLPSFTDFCLFLAIHFRGHSTVLGLDLYPSWAFHCLLT